MSTHRCRRAVLAAIFALAAFSCASRSGKEDASFATPEAAVEALVASSDDEAAAEKLLGPGQFDLLRSGDEVADRQDVETVRAMVRERLDFEAVGEDCCIALLGDDRYELPIPLVRGDDGRWSFDVEAGREEVLNRRVGRNELSTIQTLRAIVAAQREYASEGRDGRPPAYARQLMSEEGKHDGLYWRAETGAPESPLGPLLAEAAHEGYRAGAAGATPYHGYFYRLLTEQGPSAPGGARSYVDDDGALSRGFAVVAWPATYGNSGVKTFVVNQLGIVFEKDLGDSTEKTVEKIRAYDPDASWDPTTD
jgi:hypothetical protein